MGTRPNVLAAILSGSGGGNSATRWLFAAQGIVGTPWAALSRAGLGSYVDAAGLIQTTTAPRITHDPVTLQRLGLLVEGQATDIAQCDLNALAATQTRTVTASPWTVSFTGTGSLALSGAHTATVTGIGANRSVALTFTPSAGSLVMTVSGDVRNLDLVNQSYASSTIPNSGTGSAVRVTDDWRLTGADFSSAIDPAVGTIVVDFYWSPGPSVGGVFSISDNTAANRLEYRAGQGYFEVNAGGVNRAGVSGLTPVVGLNRIAVSWSAAGYAVSLNGAPPSSGTANCGGLIANQLQLGNIVPRNNTDFSLQNVIRGARSLRGQYITGAALQSLTI